SQLSILKECDVLRLPNEFAIERELAGYELADRIVVPSKHVAESFMEQDPRLVPKLFVNPYGVDLKQFPQRQSEPSSIPRTVLFVGSWSRRKGVDILMDAIRKIDGARLLHVGAIADVPFPDGDERFEHVDPVPQWRLSEYYEKAHVFALSSREEGLALVQLQALASGLPLVCTARTGGQDLQLLHGLTERISVVEAGDADAFAEQLGDMLARATQTNGMPMLMPEDRAALSWRAYGQRYFDELMRSSSLEAGVV
ncbi:MAG: glycosyltransferase involved in cell wall biosynthesis, partial [Alphaproteobacteria bacterium]